MATTEKVGIFTHVDDNGNTTLLYPVTKMEAVDGLSEATAQSVQKSSVVNNFTTTEEGFVADARALKVLNDTKQSMELLWENASYTSDFASQKINLDLSGYKEVLVLGRNAGSIQVVVGFSGYLQRINADSSKYYEFTTRPFDVSTTGITFKDAFQIYWNGSSGLTVVVSNGLIQPAKIYGIKEVN